MITLVFAFLSVPPLKRIFKYSILRGRIALMILSYFMQEANMYGCKKRKVSDF